MRKEDVPQEGLLFGRWTGISYATDEQGRYTLEHCAGWEPVNLANQQAWHLVRESVTAAVADVRAGRRSPIAVHMAVHQMSLGLLSRYVGLARWRVWWHLRPRGFARLTAADAARYASLFRLPVERLADVPTDVRIDGLLVETEAGAE
jgi:hypothetical protein